jgi:cobalt-zinc-cadmium resistance protein CzcA
MISSIIRFSVKNKIIVVLGTVILLIGGIYSMLQLPVDAVPDITNNQVQIVTTSPSLAPQEVEQFISYPLETSMANIPGVEDIRSISRFGISVITIIFNDDVATKDARQLVKEQLDLAVRDIPKELGQPAMMPVTTGLGEIYQYVLRVEDGYAYDAMELRTIQDFIVKKQLSGTKGIIEVSSFGGFLKQYEVAVNPYKMKSRNVTMEDVFATLEANNENSGGSYIEQEANAFYIRTEGLIRSLSDLSSLTVTNKDGNIVYLRDIAEIGFGSPARYGAMTMDGEGETVGGITLMLKGANSSQAIENVKTRVARIQKSLPEGVSIYPYLDRSVLVNKATSTVSKNLIEGGLIVIFVLILLLGNWRAGIIVASVIPLSLMFAFILMNYFGVSANLMSLGAIDFGIVIDGAVIVVEGTLHLIYTKYVGKRLSQAQMDDIIVGTTSKIINSAIFGVFIIIVVFLPIMTLTGIEGKMFVPMAQTVSFAILGALLLSITYVPMMSAILLKKNIKKTTNFSDKIIAAIQSIYQPALNKVLKYSKTFVAVTIAAFCGAIWLFSTMGGEFIPTLEEGDLAMQVTIEPGSSLSKMVATTTKAEQILLNQFPEVKHVVSKIGTAEVPTDPMAIEDADVMILLKEKKDWVSASNREELAAAMKKALEPIQDAQFDFTQPIELRFNELISGSKNDLAIQLFGDDLDSLANKAKEIAAIAENTRGAGDVRIEQTEGLPQLIINYDREKLAYHKVSVATVNKVVRSAFAGENAGTVYEGQRRFDLTVRLDKSFRNDIDLGQLYVQNETGENIPVNSLATVKIADGPMQISREKASRRIVVGVNVRNRDIASYVEELQQKVSQQLTLPPGYYVEYGGQFKNLNQAKDRLLIAVPIALALIFLFLYFAFKSFKYALIIYVTVPMSTIGGILALYFRGMPFSISAGVGFIALFGVAVLNGIVLISYFNDLKEKGDDSILDVAVKGSMLRLRPVLMTAAVASLGFLPMALATSAGAEVQKPLATVVIGGLVSATLLTLFVLPAIYTLSHKRMKSVKSIPIIGITLLMSTSLFGQDTLSYQNLLDTAIANNTAIRGQQFQADAFALERKKAFSLQSTELDYQYGQINSSLRDYNISLYQSLGNPVGMIRNAKLADANASKAIKKTAIIKREIRKQLQMYLLNCDRIQMELNLYENYINSSKSYIEKLEMKVKAGETRGSELGLAKIQLRQLEQLQIQSEMHLKEQTLLIQELCGIQNEVFLSKEPQLINGIIDLPADSVSLHSDFMDFNEQALETIHQEMLSRKAENFPDIALGYFNQSLDNVRNFQGVQVKLTAPIFNRSQRLDQKKLSLEKSLQAHVNQINATSWEYAMQHAYDHFKEVRAYVQSSQATYDADINLLKTSNEQEYRTGEIDYQTYLRNQEQIISAELQRIQLKAALTSAQIELIYFL